jgi:hypothetical protein
MKRKKPGKKGLRDIRRRDREGLREGFSEYEVCRFWLNLPALWERRCTPSRIPENFENDG